MYSLTQFGWIFYLLSARHIKPNQKTGKPYAMKKKSTRTWETHAGAQVPNPAARKAGLSIGKIVPHHECLLPQHNRLVKSLHSCTTTQAPLCCRFVLWYRRSDHFLISLDSIPNSKKRFPLKILREILMNLVWPN